MKSLTTISSKFYLLLILLLTSCLQEPAKVINRGNINYNKKNQFNQDKYRNINQNKPTQDSSSNLTPELKKNETVIQAGDTLYSIAKKHDVSLRDLIEVNNLEPPYQLKTGALIKIPNSNYHESREGETLYSVSRMYDMKVNDLIAINNLKFPYSIYPGDKLKIINKNNISAKNQPENPQITNNKIVEKNLKTLPAQNNNTAQNIATESKTAESKLASSENKTKLTNKLLTNNSTDNINQKPSTNSGDKASLKTNDIKIADTKNQKKPDNNIKNIINPSAEKVVETKLTINKPIDKNSIKKIANKNNEFCWPVRGTVISKFGPKSAGLFNDGINIQAQQGQSVVASEDGIVAYVGDELKGYGNLVIIKHAGGWISAYAHLKNYGVELGQKISKGQKIGLVGNTGKVKSPQLYFGLRKGRDAVNPENYLKS